MDHKDYLIPYQKVEKLMKLALLDHPSNHPHNHPFDHPSHKRDLKLDRPCVEAMQELVTEFICFVTADMTETVHREKRVALKGQDLLESLTSLGFEQYSEVLEELLNKLT